MRGDVRSHARRLPTQAELGDGFLTNGFATCSDPRRLQKICDRLGPFHLQRFFDRWIGVIPTPFTEHDRAAGYWWELSVRQVEVSRTAVFDAPRRARAFFESLATDNIGIGRPEAVAAVFARRVQKNTPGIFRTRVFTQGVEVKLDVTYKRCRVKEYLKAGRAPSPASPPRASVRSWPDCSAPPTRPRR